MEFENYVYNSDYQIDKIILFMSGELEPGNNRTIPHNLSFCPLPFGVYSYTPDFMECYPYVGIWSIRANRTDITLYNQQEDKIYYRVFGFAPASSINGYAPANSERSTGFIFNSDNNYTKLYMAGRTANTTQPETIYHRLGYKPQVMVWEVITGADGALDRAYQYYEQGSLTIPDWNDYIEITDQSIIFNRGFGSEDQFEYRIYYEP